MSDRAPCPHAAELVTLLGRTAAAAPPGHLAECALCQAELGELRDGFAAMGEDLLGRDAAAAQRIAARVMPQILAELAPEPAGTVPANVRPAPRPGRRLALPQLVFLGALATLGTVAVALYWLKLGDVPLKLAQALPLALLPLLLLPAVLGSLRLRSIVLGAALGITVALFLSTVAGLDVTALQGAGCLLLAASGSLVPALVVLRAATREQAGALSGALLGATIGSGGAAIQRLFCGSSDLSHTLVFHLGPFFFFIALSGLVGSWLGGRSGSASASYRVAEKKL